VTSAETRKWIELGIEVFMTGVVCWEIWTLFVPESLKIELRARIAYLGRSGRAQAKLRAEQAHMTFEWEQMLDALPVREKGMA
jgi:hypothetical protein